MTPICVILVNLLVADTFVQFCMASTAESNICNKFVNFLKSHKKYNDSDYEQWPTYIWLSVVENVSIIASYYNYMIIHSQFFMFETCSAEITSPLDSSSIRVSAL